MSRVLVVYHNPLFAHSVHAALRAQSEIMLVGETDDWTRAETEIARLTPDVVLVEEDAHAATDEMLRNLRTHSAPWRVVAMRLDETAMHIWSGTWQPLTRTQDLIAVLRS